MGDWLTFSFALTGRRFGLYVTQGVALGYGLAGLSARVGPQTRLFPHNFHLLNISILNTYLLSILNMSENNSKPLPAYRLRLKAERSDELYVKILGHLTKHRLYRDPNYTSRQLAIDLKTNTRYIAAAVANNTGSNYNVLVNGLRLRDACQMLRSPRYGHMTAEEIGLLSGFSSRQAFYLAFSKVYKITPRAYRLLDDGNLPGADQ